MIIELLKEEETDAEYFNPDGSTNKYIDESRSTVRTRKGISTRTGLEWTINPTTFGTLLIIEKIRER
jgi:hypothetical protein